MQSRSSFSTASLLVKTARNPLVNNWVMLFSNTSSMEYSRFGVVGPSLDDRVEFNLELGMDWKFNRPFADAEGVCGVVIDALIWKLFSIWIFVSFTVVLRSNWIVRAFKAESKLELFVCRTFEAQVDSVWFTVLKCCVWQIIGADFI